MCIKNVLFCIHLKMNKGTKEKTVWIIVPGKRPWIGLGLLSRHHLVHGYLGYVKPCPDKTMWSAITRHCNIVMQTTSIDSCFIPAFIHQHIHVVSLAFNHSEACRLKSNSELLHCPHQYHWSFQRIHYILEMEIKKLSMLIC